MRLAFIIPRYGPDILGGAESLTRGFAEKLAQRGWSIEVWTTCAHNYHTWQNVYPPGVETINGVTVRRFPTWVNRMPSVPKKQGKVFGNLPNTPLTEYGWTDEGMHSPQLYHYLYQHGPDFNYLIFIPYPFGFTCYAASLYPERSIIWPCLHDDFVAYFEPVRVMLHQARGIILNSQAEKDFLVRRLQLNPSRYAVLGYGLEATPGLAERFYQRYPHLKPPFVLYAGRLEKAKNTPLLLDYFIDYTETRPNPVNLVLIGSGPVKVPAHPRIFHLGYLSEADKHDAYAAATILCQPSAYESFGITLMEAWLQEKPVLVHGDCQVTLEHCLAAHGGAYFRDSYEFIGAMDFLLDNPNLRQQMGWNGKVYVQTNYNWDNLITRLTSTLVEWQIN